MDLTSMIPGIITIVATLGGCLIAVVAVGISGFFIYRLVKNSSQNSALLKSGVQAPAVILSADDTGVTMNESPQVRLTLQVNPPGQPSFQAVATTFVNRVQIGMIVPGMGVDVRYDPQNPGKVALESFTGAAAGATAMAGAAMPGNAQALQAQLEAQDKLLEVVRQMGQPATANILNVTDMNIRVNDQAAMLKLDLLVTAQDGSTFQAQTQGAVMDSSRAKYAPGKMIYVKYNPNDKSQVAIDHSA